MSLVTNPDGSVTATHGRPVEQYTTPSMYPLCSVRLAPGKRVQFTTSTSALALSNLDGAQTFATPVSALYTPENYPMSYATLINDGMYFASGFSEYQGALTGYTPANGSPTAGTFAIHPQLTLGGDFTYTYELSSDGKLLYCSIADANGVFTDQYNLVTASDKAYVYVSCILLPSVAFVNGSEGTLSVNIKETNNGNAHSATNPYLNFPNGPWKFYDNALVLDQTDLAHPSIVLKPGSAFPYATNSNSPEQLPNCYAPLGKHADGTFGSYEYTFQIPSAINQGANKVICGIAEVPFDSGITFPVNFVNAIKAEFKARAGGTFGWALTGSATIYPSIDWIRVESYGGVARLSIGTVADGLLAHIDTVLVDQVGTKPVVSLASKLLAPVRYAVNTSRTAFIDLPPEPALPWTSSSSSVEDVSLGDPIFATAGKLTFNGAIPNPAKNRAYSTRPFTPGMVLEIDVSQQAAEVQNAELWFVPSDFGGFDENDTPVKNYGGVRINPVENSGAQSWIGEIGLASYSGMTNGQPAFANASYWSGGGINNPGQGAPPVRLYAYRNTADRFVRGVTDVNGSSLISGDCLPVEGDPNINAMYVLVRVNGSAQSLLYYISTLNEVDLEIANPGTLFTNMAFDEANSGLEYPDAPNIYYSTLNASRVEMPIYSDGTIITGKFGGVFSQLTPGIGIGTQPMSDISTVGQFYLLYGPKLPPVGQLMSAASLSGAVGIIFKPDTGIGSMWSGAIRPFYVTFDGAGNLATSQRMADTVTDLSTCCAAFQGTPFGLKFAIIDSDRELWQQGYPAALIEELPSTPIRIWQYRPTALTLAAVYSDNNQSTDPIVLTNSFFFTMEG